MKLVVGRLIIGVNLLICSTAKSTKTQYQQYLKICNDVKLPDWNEINFPTRMRDCHL